MGIRLIKGNGNVLRFLQSCLSGLQTINDSFYSYVVNVKEDLKYNGQIINLTKRLNDLYDNTLRRIYISNQQGITTKYIFNNAERQTDYIYNTIEASTPFYLGNNSEMGIEFDFIVYVPASLVYESENFNATINRYRLADKRYKIETY